MPVGKYFDEAVDRKPPRKFHRRKKLPATGAKVVRFGSHVRVADDSYHPSESRKNPYPLEPKK